MTAPAALPAHAALTKLARVLEVDDASVSFLGHLDVETLRALRNQISDRLQEADNHRLGKVMTASRLVPIGLAATIGEKWFGATLCARLVGLVEPARAGQYARHLSVEFMADITARTDPRAVGELVHHLPVGSMQQIAAALLERGDHLTLSHFVGHIPPDIVTAVLEAIDDNAAVVRIAQYVEDLAALDPIVARLDDTRLLALVDAVQREDLWVEGVHLFGHLTSTQIARIATTLVELDEGVLRAAIDAFHRHDLWTQGLQILDHLGSDDLNKLAAALVGCDDEALVAAVDALHRHLPLDSIQQIAATLLDQGDHPTLAHFVPHLPPTLVAGLLEGLLDDAAIVRIAQHVDDLASLDPVIALLPDTRLLALVDTVQREDLWVEGLHLFGHLTSTQIARVATTLVELDEGVLDAAVDAFHRHDLWAQGLDILNHLDGPQLRRVASLLAQIDDDLINAAVTAAAHADIWEPLVHAAVAADHLPDTVAERLADLLCKQPPTIVERFGATATRLGHPGLLDRLLNRTARGETDS